MEKPIRRTMRAAGMLILVLFTTTMGATAQNIENGVGVVCDSPEQVEQFIALRTDSKSAVEQINARLRKVRFRTTQGQHKLAITFVHRSFAESDERIRTIALEGGQERIQAAHALQIRGPLAVTGMSASASRSRSSTPIRRCTTSTRCRRPTPSSTPASRSRA